MKYHIGILIVCVAVVSGWQMTFAADQAADKTAIERAVESYTTAFNARDAESLAAHWGSEAGRSKVARRSRRNSKRSWRK